MKIAVYLTVKEAKHVRDVMNRSPGTNLEEIAIAQASQKAIQAFNARVAHAENLLARVRDSEE